MNPSFQAQASQLPNALWLYDELMQYIEPELVSTTIGTLDELYKGESPAERKARMEQYAAAFFIFDECLKDLEESLWDDVTTWKVRAMRDARGDDLFLSAA